MDSELASSYQPQGDVESTDQEQGHCVLLGNWMWSVLIYKDN